MPAFLRSPKEKGQISKICMIFSLLREKLGSLNSIIGKSPEWAFLSDFVQRNRNFEPIENASTYL